MVCVTGYSDIHQLHAEQQASSSSSAERAVMSGEATAVLERAYMLSASQRLSSPPDSFVHSPRLRAIACQSLLSDVHSIAVMRLLFQLN